MADNNEFGNYLKEIRKRKKYTLKDMADFADTSDSYLSQIENGKRNPPKPDMLIRIAELLGDSVTNETGIYYQLMKKAGYLTEDDSKIDMFMDVANKQEIESIKSKMSTEKGASYFLILNKFFDDIENEDAAMLLAVIADQIRQYKNLTNSKEKVVCKAEALDSLMDIFKFIDTGIIAPVDILVEFNDKTN